MNWAKLLADAAARLADFWRSGSVGSRLIPLALFLVLLAVLLIKAVRVWQEIHDVEEPATPAELLASLEEAHVAGELDDNEIAKVRQQLSAGRIEPEDARQS
jgi:hypothetical protein